MRETTMEQEVIDLYIQCHICLEAGVDPPRSADQGSLICDMCRCRTLLILDEIGDLYEWISDAEYLANTREPASSYTKSRPPVSLHAVSLLDKRSKFRRKGDPVSAHRVLGAWSQAVVDMTGDKWFNITGKLSPYVWYLKFQLQWISAQPAVTRFARHMACVANSLRQEVGAMTTGGEDDDG